MHPSKTEHDTESKVFKTAVLKSREDVGSQLVLALEESYSAIRRVHALEHPDKPGVPEAVIVISSSTEKYGHFARSRWNVDGDQLPEIMVSAEGLKREPRAVLGTLIHEAAHGLAAARGIQDVGGKNHNKYHNRKFRDLAEELHLDVLEPTKILGHSGTVLSEGKFDGLVEDLTPKLVAYREFDIVDKKPLRRRVREVSLRCRCPRTVRVFPGVWEEGPILCGVCGDEFEE